MQKDVGSVEISPIMLYGPGATPPSPMENPQNIFNQVIGIDIFESIFSPTITADIHIFDAIELLNLFPIRGEETVSFSIQTPGLGKRKYEFMVESVVGSEKTSTNDGRYYTLRCCTRDQLNNAHKQFSKKYEDDTNAVVGDVVNTQWGVSKSLSIGGTKGTFDHLLMNVRPLQAIDLLLERAVSDKYYSSYFVFFENKDGYHFKTIEELFESGPIAKYKYDGAVKTDRKKVNLFNILNFQPSAVGNNMEKIKNGTIKSITRTLDIFTGTYEETEYDELFEYSNFVHADGNFEDFNTPYFLSQFGSFAKQFYSVKDTSRPPDFHDETIGRKRGFFYKFMEHYMDLRVYGNTDLSVGYMIDLDLPYMSGTTVPRDKGPKYKKNYLITKLKHEIKMDPDEGHAHFVRLTCNKSNLYAG